MAANTTCLHDDNGASGGGHGPLSTTGFFLSPYFYKYRRRQTWCRRHNNLLVGGTLGNTPLGGGGGGAAPFLMLGHMCMYVLLLLLAPLNHLGAHVGVHAAGGPNAVDPIMPNEWTGDITCLPGSWLDFSFEVNSKEMLNNNWLFEVEDLKPELEGYRTDALSVHLFVGAIAPDRRSGMVASEAKNRLYTLEVSYYDVKLKTYYVSVRCGDEATTFRVLARGVIAPLVEYEERDGEACEEQLVYHKFEVPAGGEALAQVVVKASKKGANAALLVMQHADTAPLRLRPPYESIAPGEEGVVDVCWVVAGHSYYVAVKTSAGCVPYTVTLTYPRGLVNSVCLKSETTQAIGDGQVDSVMHLPELEHNHFMYGKGVPFSYMDFRVHVDDYDCNDNMVIYLEDQTTGAIDPRAFGLYLYRDGAIPTDRHTEDKSEYSVNGEYTITINKWDLKQGEYVVSVYTSMEGKSFRLVPYFIHSEVPPGGHVAGFVCPGQFVFHYVQVGPDTYGDVAAPPSAGYPTVGYETSTTAAPSSDTPMYYFRRGAGGGSSAYEAGETVDVEFNVVVATGDLYYLTRHIFPPLKLSPPYQRARASDGIKNHTAQVCHAEPGRHYFGLSGGEKCAEYEVYADINPPKSDCEELTHICKADCDIQCTEMSIHHFEYDSCSPGQYKDFMLTVNEEDAASNLIFEVETLSKEVRPEALGVYLFKDEIPTDRETEVKTEYSADGIWGIIVSEHDLKVARYYLSVKCTGEEPVQFRVLAELSHSDLKVGDIVNGEVGPEAWTHYHYKVPASSTVPYRVTFLLTLFTGDVNLRTSVDYPPIKLIPPYESADVMQFRVGGDYEFTPKRISVCVLPDHTEFLGVVGGLHFAKFQVSVLASPVADLSECEGDLHRRRQLGGGSNEVTAGDSTSGKKSYGDVEEIEVNHFMRASCEPHEFVDFILPANSKRRDCNVVFEVEDLGNGFAQSALNLFIYKGEIPSNRVTEFKSTETSDGHYSVTLNAWDFKADVNYFASVRCGDEPKSFRLLTEIVDGSVEEGTHAVGYVCPGDFIYHFFDASMAQRRAAAGGGAYAEGMHFDVKFEIILHTGRVAYKTAHGEPPLKLLPPFRTTSEESTYVSLCDVVEGRHYVGLIGMGECADYELYVHTLPHRDECREPEHELSANVGGHGIVTLEPDHFTYSSCAPREVKDFVLYVSEAQSKTNLVIDVTSLEEELRLDALTVSMYEYEIPVDRETEFRRTTAPEGIWTISRSYHDMHAGAYYLSVECGDVATSFRILPLLIRAQLVPGGAYVHGEICPGDWVYHVVDVSDYVPGGKLHKDVYHASLAFDVELHSGDFYYMLRPSTPPIRLVPPYRFAKLNATEGQHTFRACQLDVEHFYNEKYYLALRGGEHCADYAVWASIDDGMGKRRAVKDAGLAPCTEQFTHGEKTMQKQTVTELVEGHFAYDSCEPFGLKLYSLYIPKGAKDNYVFDVEDTTEGTDRPGGLFVMLARQVKDGEEEIEDEEVEGFPVKEAIAKQVSRILEEVTFGINGVYRASLDAIKVETDTTYIVAVKCNDDPIRFRVSASRTKVGLRLPDQVPGQVSAEQWSIHSVTMRAPSEYDGYSSAAPNLRLAITVRVLSGAIAVAMLREGAPPGLTTMRTNHYHQGVEELSSFTMYVCDPKPGVEYFIGFYGGELPADYEILTDTEFSAQQCTLPEDDHGYVWRYFKDPPMSSFGDFGYGLMGMFGFFLFCYCLTSLFYSLMKMKEAKSKRKREAAGNERKHVEVTDHSMTGTHASHVTLKLDSNKDSIAHAGRTLSQIDESEILQDGFDDDESTQVINELDRRYGKGKGRHLFNYAKKMGIRRNRACQELHERTSRKRAYKGLVLYLFVTIVFLTIVQLQRSIPRMNELETAMQEYVAGSVTADGLGFEDLQSFDDVFLWLEGGFIESFFPAERWYNGERLPELERGYLRMYNKKLSGFMLKQKRVRVNTGDCTGSDRFSKFYPICYPDSRDVGTASSTPFGPSHDPTKYVYEKFATGGGYAVAFPLDRKQTLATLDELRRDLFLDKQTRRLELDVAVYNAAYRLFSTMSIQIRMRASGKLSKKIKFFTFPIELYVTPLDLFRFVLECLFFIFIIFSLACEVFELVAVIWENSNFTVETNFYAYFTSFENYIDLARLLMWLISLMWYIRILTNPASEDLKLPLPEGQIKPGLQEVAVLWRVYAQLNAVSVLICLCTVFRFLNLSPQYGTLVRTITRASPSLLKFLLMFVLIFGFFAVMGQLMFGTALQEWSNIWSGTQVLFQMMTGEYGYEPLLVADPYMAPVFYYSYLILVFFLLLNILLAILMDTYAIITEELRLSEEKERRRHYHSVVVEIYYEFAGMITYIFAKIANVITFASIGQQWISNRLTVPAYLTSERGLVMVMEEGNEQMIRRSIKLKLEELDADLEAVRDEDGLEDLLTYELLVRYYSEMSSILLLLSVGDPISQIKEECASMLDADEAEVHLFNQQSKEREMTISEDNLMQVIAGKAKELKRKATTSRPRYYLNKLSSMKDRGFGHPLMDSTRRKTIDIVVESLLNAASKKTEQTSVKHYANRWKSGAHTEAHTKQSQSLNGFQFPNGNGHAVSYHRDPSGNTRPSTPDEDGMSHRIYKV